MKTKSLIALLALAALVSCQSLKEEFQPVVTGFYDYPSRYQRDSLPVTHTIAQLVALYTPEKPLVITDNIVISGIVSTTDQPGNFYKSFFIQDKTGGIEIKVGKNSLYNDYLPGQRIYVRCQGAGKGALPGTAFGGPAAGAHGGGHGLLGLLPDERRGALRPVHRRPGGAAAAAGGLP